MMYAGESRSSVRLTLCRSLIPVFSFPSQPFCSLGALFVPTICLFTLIYCPFFFFLSPCYSEHRHYDMQIYGQLSSPANNSRDPKFFSFFFFFVGMNNWWSGVVTRPREKSSRARCLSSVRMKQTVKRLNPCFTDYLLAAFTVIHGPFYTALELETHLCSFPCRFAVRAVWQMKPRWTR